MLLVPFPDVDVDECLEQNVRCGPNRMCFNMRGSYRCIDTPCPPDYQRHPFSGYVFPPLPRHALENPSSPLSLTSKPCLQSCFIHSRSVSPREYGVTLCSFFNEWARNELILQQPKLSLGAAGVPGASLPSV